MTNDTLNGMGYGTVTGRFLLAYPDGADSNMDLDWTPAKGILLFTPSAPYLMNTERQITFMPTTVQCVLDSQGYIVGPDGNRGIALLATDIEENQPHDWTWQVDFRLTDQSNTPTRSISSFSFLVPQGDVIDLSTAAPMPDAQGIYYTMGPQGPEGPAGPSAYERAVDNGFDGTEAQWIQSLNGDSAYEVALANGFVGSQEEWLASLVGPQGEQGPQGVPGSSSGDSAYTVALQNGFVGTEGAWLYSLRGSSAYQVALSEGFIGTESQWIDSLRGPRGFTGEQGPEGAQGPQGLQGAPGLSGYNSYVALMSNWPNLPVLDEYEWNMAHFGKDAYTIWRDRQIAMGVQNPLNEEQWLESLHGADGATGPAGPRGIQGPAGINNKIVTQQVLTLPYGEPPEVYLSDPSLINGFNVQNAIFKIPQGPKGDAGVSNVPGPQGKSAFEIAQEQGYPYGDEDKNNEADWIYSLRGRNGLNGQDGITGENKNYLLNGALDIWQRGNTFTCARGATIRFADNWYLSDNSATVGKVTKISKTNVVPYGVGPSSSMLLEWDEKSPVVHSDIPAEDCVPLMSGNDFILSFYAKKVGGAPINNGDFNVGFQFVDAPGIPGYGFRAVASESVGDGWYRISYYDKNEDLTIGTTAPVLKGVITIAHKPNVSAVTKMYITGAQLEINPNFEASRFNRRNNSYQNELAECQERFVRFSTAAAQASYALGFQTTTTAATVQLPLPVKMRSIPSVVPKDIQWSDGVAVNSNLQALTVKPGSSTQTLNLLGTWGTAAGAAFRPGMLRGSTTASYIDLSCEDAIA